MNLFTTQELIETDTNDRSNEDHFLSLFFNHPAKRWNVVFNAITMASLKTPSAAVKVANKFVEKYDLN